jgi:N-acetylglutamate synthase-like GNAT family acetyltransferase
MMMAAEIRAARIGEEEALEQLVRRAASTIPGYREEMHAHPEAFHVSRDQIQTGRILVAEIKGEIVGLASWRPMGDLMAELDGIFVEAMLWRSGLGSDLMQAVCSAAAASGFQNLYASTVSPAVDFYRRRGFVRTGASATPLGPVLTMIKDIAQP